MPGGPRGLPDRPNLRFLKLEAKRRNANGEFAALHYAQQAIAQEHGLANWAELKRLIEPDSRAVDQLRWIIKRFRDAGEPGWMAPTPRELHEHFDERFLAAVPDLVRTLSSAAPVMAAEPVSITLADPFEVQAELAGLAIHLATEPVAPYRVTGLLALPGGKPIADDRITGAAPARAWGDRPAPDGLTELAGRLTTEFGVPALALAGADPAAQGPAGSASWVVTRGWADMDRAELLGPEQLFAAPGISFVVTATAVLRLVADGRCGLDDRASTRLRALRLADDAITIRDLLANLGGVTDPAQLLTDDVVPDLVSLLGPVAACDGQRGAFRPSNAGVGVLGQVVEDITRTPYATAMTELVLTPLGMRASRFPASAADIGDVVTGYATTRQDTFEPARAAVCTIQAAGGLWSTAEDIARLGTGWASLLPPELAREALTPQLTPAEDHQPGILPGLGWLLATGDERTAMIAGTLPGATAELFIRIRDHRVFVLLASRLMPLNGIDRQARNLWFS